MNLDHAIAELKVAFEAAEENAPTWEAEGNTVQAEASRQHARSFRDAINVLEQSSLKG